MVSPEDLEKKVEESVSEEPLEKGTSLLADSFRKFKQNKMALLGCFTIAFLFLVSIFASHLTPYNFDEGKLEHQNLPPTWYKLAMSDDFKGKMVAWAKVEASLGGDEDFDEDMEEGFGDEDEVDFSQVGSITETPDSPEAGGFFERAVSHLDPNAASAYFAMSNTMHLMGTDEIGQDIFSRLVYGMRLSLLLALTVTLVSLLIGVSYGSIAGYLGGAVDQAMMRFVDFLFGVPFIFLIILLMVFFGRHVFLIFVGLGLIYWIVLARIVRGQVLSIKEKEFVLAARSSGVSELKIIFKHLVPNVVGPVIIFSTLLVPQIMLLEAFLSFIGLGVSPPDVSLGILISDGAAVLASYSWPIIFPGLIFSLMIFCMNFIGDGLRDALDPKTNK